MITNITTITLTNTTVNAGDKIKVYYSGGTNYPTCQSGIIEFEVFNASANALVGRGSFMSTMGSQALLIGAEFVDNTVSDTRTIRLISSVYTLTDINTSVSQYANKAYVYLEKIELIK